MTPTLWFTKQTGAGPQVVLPEGPCTIGRDESADLVIPAADARFVSRRHARFSRSGADVVIEDLGSANGTWVNGTRIERTTLADGDEVQFGRRGPIARFHADLPPTRQMVPQPGTRNMEERPSVMVRKAVDQGLASHARLQRRRLIWTGAATLFAATLIAAGLIRSGWLDADPEESLAELGPTYADRMALIEVGVTQADTYVGLGVGSGFFVSDDGLVVTNKHVVRPELFSERVACVLASFARDGVSELEVTLWPGAMPFRRDTAATTGDRRLGFRTAEGSLAIAAVPDDTLLPPVEISCTGAGDGQPFTVPWRRHAADNNDLAILSVTRAAPSRTIPLAPRPAAPGDLVMVYGFPSGFGSLQGLVAEPIFRIGRVLRADDTLETDAVVLYGNSGGPLINVAGEVVGIATRGPNESLNSAIKVEHVARLLQRVRR